MKINYQETTTDLAKRIDIHNQYGGHNIDEWMLKLLNLRPGMKILDVACGSGKQVFSFYQQLNGQVEITGGDVSKDLLAQARQSSKESQIKASFVDLDFNQRFDFPDDQFDLLSCCFAVYYAVDMPFTIREMHRVLKPAGQLFTSGPMPQNKQIFYDVIREATNNQPIPPMPGSSRYNSEILNTMQSIFSKVEVHLFENPLTFNSAEPFLQYTRASLSEDRKLWGDFFKGKDDFERIMDQIAAVTRKRIERDGKLVMTKVVGGFVATK
jgi:ubiquinone/menaquinone biosynthesis C-methylase UbiE